MPTRTLALRLTPMVLNAFIVGAVGIILPHFIPYYGLSLDQGGMLVGTMQAGGVVAMLTAGFFLDRVGAYRVLFISLLLAVIGSVTLQAAPSFIVAAGGLVLLGMSSSVMSTSMNALMALTGERRAYYLGMMHAAYSFLSIISPLIAGAIVAQTLWHRYYRWTAVLAVAVLVALWVHYGRRFGEAEDGLSSSSTRESADDNGDSMRDGNPQSGSTTDGTTAVLSVPSTPWWRVGALWGIGLGVFCMAGSQSASSTWVYSFMHDVYAVPHGVATTATSLFWVGILSGRVSAIPLSARFREKSLLLAGIGSALVALVVSWVAGSWVLAMAAIVVFGYGTSGAFQLGTAWAAGHLPDRVGTASSIVVAGASAGGLILPALTAVLAESYTFAAMRWVLLVGFIVSGMAFALVGVKGSSYSARSAAA